MRVKKTIIGLVVFTMLLSSVFSGCGKKAEDTVADNTAKETTETSTDAAETIETSEDAEKKELITLDVFICDPGQAPTKDNKIYKLIEEELGVKFNFEFLVGDIDQKAGVMIASGDYPDLVMGAAQKYIDAGALIGFDQFITDETPNLKEFVEPIKNKIKDQAKGETYILPNAGRIYGDHISTKYEGPAFWIQKAVLKEFNYPQVKTLDQYFDLIKQYKEKYPEIDGQPTIGFQICTFDWRNFCLKNAPAQLSGHPNDGGINVDNNVASVYANSDYAKQYYKKLNEAYNTGLLMPETFVENYDEYLAKLSTGAVLGMFDQGWNFAPANDSLVVQEKFERTYAPLAITLNESITPYYLDRPGLNLNCGFGITTSCEYPERVIELFDTLLSERWQKILQWGIEGEDYFVDENGKFYRDETQRKNSTDPNWILANKARAYFDYAPHMEGTFSDGNACRPENQPDEYFATINEYDQEFLAGYGIKMLPELLNKAPENPKYYPAWTISIPEGSDAAIATQKLDELQSKLLPQVILTGVDEFENAWADYIKKYEDVNIDAYLDVINEGIQWRLSNW
jgi:putative aldouronate transport system substrate-binding protein